MADPSRQGARSGWSASLKGWHATHSRWRVTPFSSVEGVSALLGLLSEVIPDNPWFISPHRIPFVFGESQRDFPAESLDCKPGRPAATFTRNASGVMYLVVGQSMALGGGGSRNGANLADLPLIQTWNKQRPELFSELTNLNSRA